MNERVKKLYQLWNDWRAQLYGSLEQLRVDELQVYEGDLREALTRIRQEVAARDGERHAFSIGDRITTSLGRSRAVPGVVAERSYDAAEHAWSYRVQADDGSTYWLRVMADRSDGVRRSSKPPVATRAVTQVAESVPVDEPADFFTQ